MRGGEEKRREEKRREEKRREEKRRGGEEKRREKRSERAGSRNQNLGPRKPTRYPIATPVRNLLPFFPFPLPLFPPLPSQPFTTLHIPSQPFTTLHHPTPTHHTTPRHATSRHRHHSTPAHTPPHFTPLAPLLSPPLPFSLHSTLLSSPHPHPHPHPHPLLPTLLLSCSPSRSPPLLLSCSPPGPARLSKSAAAAALAQAGGPSRKAGRRIFSMDWEGRSATQTQMNAAKHWKGHVSAVIKAWQYVGERWGQIDRRFQLNQARHGEMGRWGEGERGRGGRGEERTGGCADMA